MCFRGPTIRRWWIASAVRRCLILKQATLTDVPNELMFRYLTNVVCNQVVSQTSFLQTAVSFTEFHKTSCLKSLLNVVYTLRSRIKYAFKFRCWCKVAYSMQIFLE
ncbi:unnamed protein product [Soboliphyme baturini]|uniref:Mediator of RNA polymerase II transcription subunit 24 n=1 Tax=Soboliphyme baturini TaxID=241478 RepID=A0A183JB82_9BILA|nr:unnamed protein product [Soboliphyme baturini]